MTNGIVSSQACFNLIGSEFPLKQGLRTSEVCELLRILAGTSLSSTDIRQALKKNEVLEIPADQGTLVVKLAPERKKHGRYRCDILARPVSFVA